MMVALAAVWAQVCQSNLLIFSKLGLALELGVLLSCLVRCEAVGGVCSHSVLLRDQGLTPTSVSAMSCTPLPLRSLFCPLLPLLGCFFPPTSFFLSFFPPFLLTHMHKALFISHPAPSVLSASRSSLFLSYIHSNPLP